MGPRGCNPFLEARVRPSPAQPSTTATETQDDRIGYKGLFEISRMSGAPGIVGVANVPEGQLPPESQIEVCATAHTNPAIRRLVKSVIRGLRACQEPEKALDGMGGTYFFCNENGQKVAILKPCDEEPLAPNNPKGYVGRALGDPGWKPTVRVGEAAMREVAAYLLDGGFAKVPTSVLVRARHPIFCYNNSIASVRASTNDLTSLPMKLGSLQEFVPHECDTSEMGSSRFLTKDVHRIGILDIRLFNTDRHAGNMLARAAKESSDNLLALQYELVPIDHGFCLPETLESPYLEWLHWPQAMLPFSAEELQYIRDLNIEADKELLRKELPNLRPECIRVLELTTALLQRCAEAGMTLYEIGTVISRPFVDADEDPSELEKICNKAKRCFEMQEIAEEDEASSEGEDVDPAIEGIEDIGDEGSAEASEERIVIIRAPHKLLGCGSNSTEDDAMMFDLEEDATGKRTAFVKNMSSSTTFEPVSPSQYSVGSSVSSADFSTTPAPVEPTKNVVMARSIHVPNSFLWRMSSRRRQGGKRLQKPNSPVSYPPAVVTQCGSINFGDFTERSWFEFKREVLRMVDDSIRSGRWRQAMRDAMRDGPGGSSCPRF